MDGPRPLYSKHNSFVELRGTSEAEAQAARIATYRQSRNRNHGLSAAHAQILEQVFTDLLDPTEDSSVPRFALTTHVIAELETIGDADLGRYLVHRYRYEIFPKRKLVDEYPPYLQIEPSSVCNYRCVFCFETDPTFTAKSAGFMGRMSLELFKQVVDAAHGHVEFLSLASRGEPFVCPDIVKMLEYTTGKFLNLKINTNASLLDEAKCHAVLAGGVKTVVFSADAAEEPLYSKLRVNGKLSVVLKNIELFQRVRQQYPDRRIITRVSGVKVSEDQDLDSMLKLWSGLVDQVAFVQYNPWENVYGQAPNGLDTSCSDLWRRMFVWWDGKVNPCDVDYKSTLSVGSFPAKGLSELWQSAQYDALRASHLNGSRQSLAPCNRCTVI